MYRADYCSKGWEGGKILWIRGCVDWLDQNVLQSDSYKSISNRIALYS